MTNTESSRFIFESARESDGKELLEILEDAAFKGNISLLYTRRPNAYRSLKQEAKDVWILLARDTQNGKIAGFGACAVRKLFVNGSPQNVAYFFSLRIARSYQKKAMILHRAYDALYAQTQGKQIVCYLTTILDENHYARKLLEKPRPFMPAYTPFGTYEVFAMRCRSTRHSKRKRGDSLVFRQSVPQDIEALTNFLNREGRKYHFFPVVHAADLQNGRFYGLAIKDFYLLHSEDGEILAAGVPWDQRHYKQYIVQGYGGALKYLRPLSRISPLFGYPALPVPGSALVFFTLSFWAIRDNDPQIFERFLSEITNISRQYPFFLLGLHERHPLYPVLQQRPHLSYRSKLYRVSRQGQESSPIQLDQTQIPYLECGLL